MPYLFIFSIAALVVVPLLGRLPATTRAGAMGIFARPAPTGAGCVAFGVLSGLTMFPMNGPMLDTSISFLPAIRVLVAYAVFFLFGWLLFVRRDLVPSFGHHPWRYLTAGLVMSVIYLASVLQSPFTSPTTTHVVAVMLAGVAMWPHRCRHIIRPWTPATFLRCPEPISSSRACATCRTA